jgi:O-antigen ligase
VPRRPLSPLSREQYGETDGSAQLALSAIPWILFVLVVPTSPLIKPASLDQLAWLGCDLAAIVYFVHHPDRFRALLGTAPLILAWPILAIASAAWSLTPAVSAYHGLQLLGTVLAGFAMRDSLGLVRILKILFLGLFCGQVLSILASVAVPRLTYGLDGGWSGIYIHKNVLGSMMSLQLLCAACLFLQGWRRLLTATGFLLAMALLLKSHSASSLVAGLVGLAPLTAILAWRRGNLFVGFCLGITVAVVYGNQIANSILNNLGKDATLTGRTILWQFGLDQFWREPFIGVGYQAYWESPLTTAPYLRFVIKQPLWFFHNNFVDVAVAFGSLGLILLASGLVDTLAKITKYFLSNPYYVQAWPILFFSQVMVFSSLECVLFLNHTLHQLLFAALLPIPVKRLSRRRVGIDYARHVSSSGEPDAGAKGTVHCPSP